MIRDKEEKRKRILKYLKDFGRQPSTKIAYICKMEYNSCLKILHELKKESLLIRELETMSTYWRLK